MYLNIDFRHSVYIIGRKTSCFGKKTNLQNKIVAFRGRYRTCFQNNCTSGVLSNHRVLEENENIRHKPDFSPHMIGYVSKTIQEMTL